MRAWLLSVVVVLVACGRERATTTETTRDVPGNSPPAGSGSGLAASPEDDVGRRIADELVKLPSNRLLYLHEIGWIEIKTYAAYEGRDPRTGSAVDVDKKRLPFFTTAPGLAAEIAHRPPPPQPAAWRDERGRYMAAIHDGDQNPPGEDPELDVIRIYWSDDVIDRARQALLADRRVEISHVCRLEIVDDHLIFATAPELEQRLNPP